jgi:hypothetical protein
MPETKSIFISHAREDKKLGSEFFSHFNSGVGVIPYKIYSSSIGGSVTGHGEIYRKEINNTLEGKQ